MFLVWLSLDDDIKLHHLVYPKRYTIGREFYDSLCPHFHYPLFRSLISIHRFEICPAIKGGAAAWESVIGTPLYRRSPKTLRNSEVKFLKCKGSEEADEQKWRGRENQK